MARPIMRWGVSVIVFFVVLETCIRLEDHFRWNAPLLGGYSYGSLFVTDSLGRHLRPGYAFQKFQINRFGFRGPDINRTRPAGTVRVAVLGSSEAFGHQETPSQEFPRQLERMLSVSPTDPVVSASNLGAEPGSFARAPHALPDFQVVNAGIPGMSIVRMEEYWSDWVRGFDPQVVVVYPNPAFYLSADPPADSMVTVEGPPAPVRDEIRLVSRVKATLDRLFPERLQVHLKRLLIARVRSEHDASWSWDEVPPDRLELYERHLSRLLEALKASGVQVVLATHASAVEPPFDAHDRITLVRWQRFQPRADPEVILDFEARANEVAARLAVEHGATVVPLHELVPKDQVHFSDHQHFTDDGAAVVAEALAGVVWEAGLAAWSPGETAGDGISVVEPGRVTSARPDRTEEGKW